MYQRIFIYLFSIWATITLIKIIRYKKATSVKVERTNKMVADTIKVYDTTTVFDTVLVSRLTEAMIYVESKGNDSAYNHKSNAAGCLQIRPIMVREVNRICTKLDIDKQFTNNDRYSRKKSIIMFKIWKDFHHSNDPPEVIARCWNGGGDGHTLNSTIKYWKKVKEKL